MCVRACVRACVPAYGRNRQDDDEEEDAVVDIAELFEVIWDGYKAMRLEYFKQAVGPSKVSVVEKVMQKLEAQTQRAIAFGERRLDVIAAELKVGA